MIKTTVKSINAAKEALKRLAKAELPARVSYTVARLIRAIDGELALYEVQRIKLCEKYGEINAEGTRYIIKDAVSFTREHTDLENTEVELNAEKRCFAARFLHHGRGLDVTGGLCGGERA